MEDFPVGDFLFASFVVLVFAVSRFFGETDMESRYNGAVRTACAVSAYVFAMLGLFLFLSALCYYFANLPRSANPLFLFYDLAGFETDVAAYLSAKPAYLAVALMIGAVNTPRFRLVRALDEALRHYLSVAASFQRSARRAARRLRRHELNWGSEIVSRGLWNARRTKVNSREWDYVLNDGCQGVAADATRYPPSLVEYLGKWLRVEIFLSWIEQRIRDDEHYERFFESIAEDLSRIRKEYGELRDALPQLPNLERAAALAEEKGMIDRWRPCREFYEQRVDSIEREAAYLVALSILACTSSLYERNRQLTQILAEGLWPARITIPQMALVVATFVAGTPFLIRSFAYLMPAGFLANADTYGVTAGLSHSLAIVVAVFAKTTIRDPRYRGRRVLPAYVIAAFAGLLVGAAIDSLKPAIEALIQWQIPEAIFRESTSAWALLCPILSVSLVWLMDSRPKAEDHYFELWSGLQHGVVTVSGVFLIAGISMLLGVGQGVLAAAIPHALVGFLAGWCVTLLYRRQPRKSQVLRTLDQPADAMDKGVGNYPDAPA